MKIIDINEIPREVESLKIVTHARTAESFQLVSENVDGELVTTKQKNETEVKEDYVEATFLRNGNIRFEWYPRGIFEELNPGVVL